MLYEMKGDSDCFKFWETFKHATSNEHFRTIPTSLCTCVDILSLLERKKKCSNIKHPLGLTRIGWLFLLIKLNFQYFHPNLFYHIGEVPL